MEKFFKVRIFLSLFLTLCFCMYHWVLQNQKFSTDFLINLSFNNGICVLLFLSQREKPSELNFVYKTPQHILVDISGMRHVAARLVPKDITFVQRHNRKTGAEDLISVAKNYPIFLKRMITGDKTCAYEYDMKTSQQSSK